MNYTFQFELKLFSLFTAGRILTVSIIKNITW